MEFEGRITRVLPAREGTSQRGNSWKALPFIFAYFENDDQRWEDRVLLETFDTTIIAQIGQFCEKDANGKVVIENGSVKLKTIDIKCHCGFSHGVKDVTRRDGSGTATINEMRCYKLEIKNEVVQGHFGPANPKIQTVYPAAQPAQEPFPPQQPEADDLPF